MPISRRRLFGAATAFGLLAAARAPRPRPIDLIATHSNLGLRPLTPGHEPGAWAGGDVLLAEGLADHLHPCRIEQLPRPKYDFAPQAGTLFLNGHTLRTESERLARTIERSLAHGGFPLVVGGDCSNLIGAMLGLRRAGGRGCVHVDGHTDYLTVSNFGKPTDTRTAAGADLALAAGRGEAILTEWPGLNGPLLQPQDCVQIGERYAENPGYAAIYRDIQGAGFDSIPIEAVKRDGIARTAERTLAHLRERRITRAWLHFDVDVFAQDVMPAVDSTDTTGLTFAEARELVSRLLASGRIAGADIAIYDPEKDPTRAYAKGLVDCLGPAFATA